MRFDGCPCGLKRMLAFHIVLIALGSATVFAAEPTAPIYPRGLTVVSESAAETLFREVANDSGIPFDYPDGCYAKAEKADIFLEQKGIIAGKAFVEGQIYYQSHWGPSFWTFHVAPLILVTMAGQVRPYVIDPFLSPKLVTYQEWLNLVRTNPNTTIDRTFFTNRFVYGPPASQADLNPDRYGAKNLQDMKTVLQQIRDYLAGYKGQLSR